MKRYRKRERKEQKYVIINNYNCIGMGKGENGKIQSRKEKWYMIMENLGCQCP